MFKVFYDCQAKREVDGVALLAFSRHSAGPRDKREWKRAWEKRASTVSCRYCSSCVSPFPSFLLQLPLLLTAKSNLHVFSKLIVMMAFVDAVFCALVFVIVAAAHRASDSNRMYEWVREREREGSWGTGYRLNIWWGRCEATTNTANLLVFFNA